MKKSLLVVALVLGLSDVASAQGMDIHNRYGASGTHFDLPANTQTFNYGATITGGTLAYKVSLQVYHNDVLKAVFLRIVALPPPEYQYSQNVNMGGWGLKPGDDVTFVCTVIGLALGNILDVDYLHGDVVEPQGTF